MWQPVKSSNIAEMKHEGEEMQVRFHGGAIYSYQGVPTSVYQAVLGAASVGRTFNELIKSKPGVYGCCRVN